MKILFYKKTGCIWCDKMEKYLMDCGFIDNFDVVTVTENNHREVVPFLIQVTDRQEVGFPITIIRVNDIQHVIIGFDPYSTGKIFEKLKE